jgi:hypothetical protein
MTGQWRKLHCDGKQGPVSDRRVFGNAWVKLLLSGIDPRIPQRVHRLTGGLNAEISALDTQSRPSCNNRPRSARRLWRRRRHRRHRRCRRRRQPGTDPLLSRLGASVRRGAHPAGSSKTNGRHRLNPGRNRHANHALWRVVITRLEQGKPRTVAYIQRPSGPSPVGRCTEVAAAADRRREGADVMTRGRLFWAGLLAAATTAVLVGGRSCRGVQREPRARRPARVLWR